MSSVAAELALRYYTGPGEKRKRWPQLSAAVVQAASV